MFKLYIKEDVESRTFLKEILKLNDITDYEIIYNEYGKPYINKKGIYFNISHDENITVIAISSFNVGVDIEKISYKDNVINKICNEEELRLLNSSKNKELTFTDIWTKKEAYVKAIGIGLEFGLKNVNTLNLDYNTINYKDYIINVFVKK